QESERHVFVFCRPTFSDPYAGELIPGHKLVGLSEVGKALFHCDEADWLVQNAPIALLRLQPRPTQGCPASANQIVVARVNQSALLENIFEHLSRAGLKTRRRTRCAFE